MNKGLIIFDFDGVIVDSFDCTFPLIQDAMKHIGLSLTADQYRNFFMGNIHQGYKDFINDEEKYLVFSKFRKDNFDSYYQPEIFPGMTETLHELKKHYILTIASSGKQDTIMRILQKNGLANCFDTVLATTDSSKENMIRELLKKYTAQPNKTTMITDTVGDIEIAKKSDLKTLAVTWGFQSETTLKSAQPDYIIRSPNEIQNTLDNT
jgi:phosphoglycolate phosphatase